jgi:DNA primase
LALYSDEVLGRVRDGVDILSLISDHVPLKKAGTNYKGLCPFHAEKTPSFTVNPARQIFHCFGCGKGGDVFKFLMLLQNLSFPEAVEALAQRAGVSLPRRDSRLSGPKKDEGGIRELLRVNAEATKFFRERLASEEGREAREYLQGRGLDAATIEAFSLGYAPRGWRSLLDSLLGRGIPLERVLAAGLARPRAGGEGYYDAFRDRVIFPIQDVEGRVVGFGGRLLKEEERAPKYLNSIETALFKKGRTLYGLCQARGAIGQSRTAIVVEGYFDVIALHQHGLQNAVATMGTALTVDQVKTLRRGGHVETLILCFDPDEAGEEAARRGGAGVLGELLQGAPPEGERIGAQRAAWLAEGGWDRIQLRVAKPPAGKDVDALVREQGEGAIQSLLSGARNLIDFLMDRCVSAIPPTAPIEERLAALQGMGPLLARLWPSLWPEYFRRLSERLHVRPDVALRALSPKKGRREALRATVEVMARNEGSPPAERELVHILLTRPREMAPLWEQIPLSAFRDQALRKVAEAILGVFASGGVPEPTALLTALEDPASQAWVSSLSVEEGSWEDVLLLQAAGDCIARIRQDHWREESRLLQEKILEAQARGAQGEVLAPLQEKDRLRSGKIGVFTPAVPGPGGVGPSDGLGHEGIE